MVVQAGSDEWMDTDDVCRITGHERNTIEGWRTRGVGPVYYKFGHLVRYKRSDIDAWIEKHRRVPSSVQLENAQNG